MPRINILDDNMINMIAAGEVIERPASVVKELLENSIDAGADKIVLRIEDGGRRLISITDNGCGIDAEDIPKAFMPHATSKLKTRDDLFNITTMGFRGEALASIAQVSKVTLTSRTRESIEANTVSVDCGKKTEIRPSSGDVGTTIEVRDLFYKLPARQKFLRTGNTEMTHITEHFTRIALSHTHLDLTMTHNNRQLYRLTANQSVRDRINALFSDQISEDLLETQSDEKGMKVRAFIGKPSISRGNNKFQYTFLNNRCIRDKFINHAIKEAYRGLIEPNKHPVAFLFLQVDPASYDVNVHPTKTEVRFMNSNLIHSQVLAVLREKLLSTNLDVKASLADPRIGDNEFSNSDPSQPANDEGRRERIASAMNDFFKSHKSSSVAQKPMNFSGSHKVSSSPKPGFSNSSYPPRNFNRPAAHSNYSQTAETGSQDTDSDQANPSDTADMSCRPVQVHNSYILIETEEGFAIIDQHALHERIIYEQLRAKLRDGKLTSQRLLIPDTVEVTPAQAEIIKTNSKLISQLGIELEDFGPSTIAIQSFPTILKKADPLEFVQDLLDKLADKSLGLDAEKLIHEVLDMAACKAAVKAGQPLTEAEMCQLIRDRENIERSSRCPHGRPTVIHFSLPELEKQFKRTGF